MYLELEFMLVLPVARQREPRSKQAAISPKVFTSVSVTPARVMPPLLVSLIWIGGFITGPVLRPPPKASPAVPAPHWSSAGGGFGSRRSCTSSLRIWWSSPSKVVDVRIWITFIKWTHNLGISEIVQETIASNLEIIKEGRRILSFLIYTTPSNDLLVVLLLYFILEAANPHNLWLTYKSWPLSIANP